MITAELVSRGGPGTSAGSTESTATGNSVARARTALAAKSGRMRLICLPHAPGLEGAASSLRYATT